MMKVIKDNVNKSIDEIIDLLKDENFDFVKVEGVFESEYGIVEQYTCQNGIEIYFVYFKLKENKVEKIMFDKEFAESNNKTIYDKIEQVLSKL